jgi:hypothetical protein
MYQAWKAIVAYTEDVRREAAEETGREAANYRIVHHLHLSRDINVRIEKYSQASFFQFAASARFI